MRLLACHIDNFGKLQNTDMEFSEGLNQIHKPNGWGKSTFAAFLKAMFYGLDARKNRRLMEKERNYYRPWQGGAFGGWVEFEADGKRYRISRTFGKTEKDDSFHLYDAVTNLESGDFSAAVGEELFDLDGASFERSVFLAQNDCGGGATDGIHAKLGNLVENANDINNFELASAKLKDRINHMSPTRATGSISKRRQQLESLRVKLRGVEHVQEDYALALAGREELSLQKKTLSEQKQDCEQAIRELAQQELRREKRMQYEQLCAEQEQKESAWESCQSRFPAGVPTEDEFRRMTGTVRQLADMQVLLDNLSETGEERQAYERLSGQFQKGVPRKADVELYLDMCAKLAAQKSEIGRMEDRKQDQLDEIADCSRRLEQPSEKKNTLLPASVALYAFGCLLCLGAILICLFFWAECPWFVPPVLFGLDVLCLIIATVLLAAGRFQKRDQARLEQEMMNSQIAVKQDAVERLEQEIRKLQRKQEENSQTVAYFLKKYGKTYAQEEAVGSLHELLHEAEEYQRLLAKREKFQNACEQKNAYLEQLRAFAEGYRLDLREDRPDALGDVQLEAAEYRRAQQEKEQADRKLAHFLENHPVEELLREPDGELGSEEELKRLLERTEEELKRLLEQLEQLGRSLELLEEQLAQKEEWEEELERLESLQERETYEHSIFAATQKLLQRAREQFLANYKNPVAEGFQKYYAILAGTRQEEWQMDSNLDCRLRQQGELREPGALSAGTRDLIGFSMRLALADAMYPGQKPFLLLDDPFVNLDGAYVRQGISLLRVASLDYQIIYFTCHESRTAE